MQRFVQDFLQLPALNQIGKIFAENKNDGLEKARQCAWAMAAEVLHYGIDISFAPVLDLIPVLVELLQNGPLARSRRSYRAGHSLYRWYEFGRDES
ncbi:MAG: hypothetical protein CM1200mP40_34730 [Gammaproteobacteria bacterium]|nr:MAG: hypothetical protein CM1200mP40_34730 [Gammaproteobacteria bacterium]